MYNSNLVVKRTARQELSWIEYLATNQVVVGSTPAWRAISPEYYVRCRKQIPPKADHCVAGFFVI